MTKEQAELYVNAELALRHRVVVSRAELPMNEPGKHYVIVGACPQVIHDGYKVIKVDDSLPCNCNAALHWKKLDEARRILNTEIK